MKVHRDFSDIYVVFALFFFFSLRAEVPCRLKDVSHPLTLQQVLNLKHPIKNIISSFTECVPEFSL